MGNPVQSISSALSGVAMAALTPVAAPIQAIKRGRPLDAVNPLKAAEASVKPITGGTAAVTGALKSNPVGKAVLGTAVQYGKAVATGGGSLLTKGGAQQFMEPGLQGYDEISGNADKRKAGQAAIDAQAAAAERNLRDLNAQQAQQDALSSETARQAQARRQQQARARAASGRRSTILTGPLGIMAKNSSQTYLGGGSMIGG